MAANGKSANSVNFTRGVVESFACPPDKSEAFLWDAKVPGLGLRAYKAGSVVYLYQARLSGTTVRVRIGSRDAWDIDKARVEARRLQGLVDKGIDPRDERRERDQAREQARAARQRASVTVGEAWTHYIAAQVGSGRWSDRHKKDNDRAMQPPGLPRKRSKLLTKAGTLYQFRECRLADLSAAMLEKWMKAQNAERPTEAALGFRLFRTFLNWCDDQPEYRGLADPRMLLTKQLRKSVTPVRAKKDVLDREMLGVWFNAIGSNADPVVSAYFEAVLLTGARPGELIALRWEDVDFQWRKLVIRDKVEGEREIPLTPYLAQRLGALPRRNAFVFSSVTSASGHLVDVNHAHTRALKLAGLPHVTLHGLRRSFGSLSEWVDCPVGVVAQIQGHKPSAIAEKHYRVRRMDRLREWHTKIEGWILEQAGIEQPLAEQATGLRVVG